MEQAASPIHHQSHPQSEFFLHQTVHELAKRVQVLLPTDLFYNAIRAGAQPVNHPNGH
jgi:hypothetical protein